MPEQLKIIIDAEPQKAIQGLKAVADVATKAGAQIERAFDFNTGRFEQQIKAVNLKLQSLKISPVDVTVNTSGLDSTIKNIQAKFASLVDPKINVLANTAQAEASIKDLIGELSALKGSEIFIKANDTQALKAINEIEAELNSLVGKQIRVNVDTTGAVERINVLEKELLALESLKVTPNISSTQLSVFEANIKRIKAEIASLKGQGIVVPIGINTATAQTNLNKLSETIETLRAKIEARKSFITVETDITKIAAYNKEIEKLEARMRSIQNVGKKGFEIFVVPGQAINSVKSLSASVAAFGGGVKTFVAPAVSSFKQLPSAIGPVITQLKAFETQAKASGAAATGAFSKAFQGLRSFAALIPGIGLGGIIGLAATAVNSLTEGFFDAAFGASKLDKAIDAAAGSIDKNSASVITMVKALQSGTLSSSEFKRVKAELIAQAPEFQKSFDGDKISIEASDKALLKYIEQLTTTIRVTAALGIVNDTLAKSIKAIAKGEDFSFGEAALSFLESGLSGFGALEKTAVKSVNNVQKAIDSLKPENISKLLDETFKKLGITFKDFAGTVDGNALKASLDKIKADFEKFQNETIAKAQQFKKEFGETFILPQLEVSFFVNKDQVFKNALKVLNDFKTGNLKIKLPVFTDFDFLPTETKLTDAQIQELTKGFFEGVRIEKDIPITVTPDISLEKGFRDKILQKLDLEKQFSVFGKFGDKEFDKIFKNINTLDLSALNAGIAEATNRLGDMTLVATTLNQAIGQGLVNSFNAVFDAINDGKQVFKALAQALKQLIIDTVKAVAQMLILKAVSSFITGGAGGLAGFPLSLSGISRERVGSANFGGIGGRSFNNVIQIVGSSRVSGNDIVTSYTRATNSSGRFG